MKCICEMCGQVVEPLEDRAKRGNGTITPDELATICKTVVELTEIRQRGCNHLCVENAAPDIFGKILAEYAAHKKGSVEIQENWNNICSVPADQQKRFKIHGNLVSEEAV